MSEARAESIHWEEDLAGAAERAPRAGPSQREADGPADEAAATCCFTRGLVDLGTKFALRAARAYYKEGHAEAVGRVLAAASTHTPAMSSRAMASLARARAGAGELTKAAEMLAAAAERSRNEGRVEQALDYCLSASRWHAPVRGVHRTWCLALLASGDPDGAVGHLARWGSEVAGGLELTRAHLEAACGPSRAGELIARAGRLAEGAVPAARMTAGWSRAFLAPGLAGRREQLVRVLTDAQIEVVEASCEGGVSDALVRALPLDLLILPVGPRRYPRADWLRSINAHPGLEGLPILGALVGELDVDQLAMLRMLGLAGVLDLGAAAEQVMFRVGRVLRRAGPERRVHTRIPVAFDVTVDADGVVTTQRAESLSSGGLRLRSSLALEVNREIRLRFRPEPEMASIRANARVVTCALAKEGEGGHAVGVFFLDLSASDRMRLDSLVARRLAGAPPAAPGQIERDVEQERPLGVRRDRQATDVS